jgi:hypothetical protein
VDSCCSTPPCGLSGATFTVKNGATTVANGTTGAGGTVTLDVGMAGDYTVVVAYGGNTLTQSSTSLFCGTTYTYYNACLVVTGCIGAPLAGASVTIAPGAGLSLSNTTVTTGADGKACWPYPSPGFDYSITRARFDPASGTVTGCSNVQLAATSGYRCTSCCNLPVCETINGTDIVVGGVTMTYVAGPNKWRGTVTYPFPGYCGCPAASVPITYTWPGNGGCNFVNVSMPTGGGPGNLCTVGFSLCGTDVAHASGTTNTDMPISGSLGCDPLSGTFTATGCTCTTCSAFGNTFPHGCAAGSFGGANWSALWGGATPMFTISDAC